MAHLVTGRVTLQRHNDMNIWGSSWERTSLRQMEDQSDHIPLLYNIFVTVMVDQTFETTTRHSSDMTYSYSLGRTNATSCFYGTHESS